MSEKLPLSEIVASNALLQQGILPGTDIEDQPPLTPLVTAEIVASIASQASELPISEERKTRVLTNAAESIEDQSGSIDSRLFNRDVHLILIQQNRARAQRQKVARMRIFAVGRILKG